MAGTERAYRIEELDENTEYNVTVMARTAAGQYGQAAHSVMRTDDLSECTSYSLNVTHL